MSNNIARLVQQCCQIRYFKLCSILYGSILYGNKINTTKPMFSMVMNRMEAVRRLCNQQGCQIYQEELPDCQYIFGYNI